MHSKSKSQQTGWMNEAPLFKKVQEGKNGVCQNEKNKQKKNQEEIIKSPSPDRRLVCPAEVKHG